MGKIGPVMFLKNMYIKTPQKMQNVPKCTFAPFGTICDYGDHLRSFKTSFWTTLDLFGPFWMMLDRFEPLGIFLVPFQLILVPFYNYLPRCRIPCYTPYV